MAKEITLPRSHGRSGILGWIHRGPSIVESSALRCKAVFPHCSESIGMPAQLSRSTNIRWQEPLYLKEVRYCRSYGCKAGWRICTSNQSHRFSTNVASGQRISKKMVAVNIWAAMTLDCQVARLCTEDHRVPICSVPHGRTGDRQRYTAAGSNDVKPLSGEVP